MFEGDDDIKIVNIATVMFVTEIVGDETVELVEEDIGDKLAGEIANDDTAAGFAIEETFVWWEGGPVGLRTADDNTTHRVVINNLMPNEAGEVIKPLAVERMAEDAVLLEVVGWELVERSVETKLAVETPGDTLV